MTDGTDDLRTDDMNELDELLGAYALDATDADERRRVQQYLTINPRAAAEVAEHHEAAAMLAFTGMDAPADLWGRIESELREEPPPLSPELAKVMSIDDHPVRRRSATSFWLGGAAAAAVILVVAVAWFGFSSTGDDPLDVAYESTLDAADSQAADLLAEGSDAAASGVVDADGHGYLDARELPALEPGLTYQLWGVVSETGDVISLGILGPSPEVEIFSAVTSLDALAITIEEEPGVISDGNPVGAYVGAFG